jgi:hypothetical protein
MPRMPSIRTLSNPYNSGIAPSPGRIRATCGLGLTLYRRIQVNTPEAWPPRFHGHVPFALRTSEIEIRS